MCDENLQSIVNNLGKKYWRLMLNKYDDAPSFLRDVEKLTFIQGKSYLNAIEDMESEAESNIKQKDSQIKKSHPNNQLCFITMTMTNRNESNYKAWMADVQDFVHKVLTLPKYKPFEDGWTFCFEATTQYRHGHLSTFGNFHCHFLCRKQKNYNKNKYINTIKSRFGPNLLFNVNYKSYPIKFYQDKKDYLLGKKDQEQYDKPEITKLMRDQCSLMSVYSQADDTSLENELDIQITNSISESSSESEDKNSSKEEDEDSDDDAYIEVPYQPNDEFKDGEQRILRQYKDLSYILAERDGNVLYYYHVTTTYRILLGYSEYIYVEVHHRIYPYPYGEYLFSAIDENQYSNIIDFLDIFEYNEKLFNSCMSSKELIKKSIDLNKKK